MAARGNPHIEFAGDYNLASIAIHSHNNTGRPGIDFNKTGVDIKDMVVEFNLYESIFQGSMTGDMVIADSTNLIGSLPIQGTERLSFVLSTPGMPGINCSEFSGHPMHIYKLTDKKQASDGIQTYVLHFCSREFLRNLRTKVSKSYSGRIDEMVNSILGDKELTDTRKEFFYEKTQNQDKLVMTNKRPFDAIGMLCKRALSERSGAPGYYFYETSKGFHFRSWESMCVNNVGEKRDPVQTFRYMPMNIVDENIEDKISHDYTSVEEYSFANTFHDVAANTAMGTYGHRIITHNIFNKSYNISDFNYHRDFSKTEHTEPNTAIVNTPVDFDDKSVSEYPESRITVQATTQYAHNEDTGSFGVDVAQDGVLEGQRDGQVNQIIAGTRLQMRIKGQTSLQVGDVIKFDLISVENKTQSTGSLDEQYSGRYIISKIRHRVTKDDYKQIIECSKDSVFTRYNQGKSTFPGKRRKNETGFSTQID
tara:strand:+ start:145 stop:1581 length:1437 start_codon:yes stop_codon:yes gene_type:complete